jgi:hypothetical protein
MLKSPFRVLLVLLALSPAALATTFVVPTDDEMVARADAIVIARAEGHWVDMARDIETVYEMRIERTIKGSPRAQELLRIVSPGGELEDRGVSVPGAPRFANGERALLFLTYDHGRWMTTDLTLGKFRFVTATLGEHVLVRDLEDVVGWDRSGAPHVERVRRENGFLRFLEERVAGRRPAGDYFVAPNSLTLNSNSAMDESAIGLEPHAPAFPAFTYTDNVFYSTTGTYLGTRWQNISAGVTFYKRSETSIAGAADGGVSVIQNALASWNNEPLSNINLIYGGQRASTPSKNQDGISVVEFNDPQNRIGGSWGGAGTVATTFISYFNPHEFPAGTLWWSIRDADVVFQDGYTASNASFATAMTHEIGHGIGWRHSNAHYTRPNLNDEPCQPGVEECSSNAIMYFQAISSLGYTLQTWDQNAAQAVYPGGGSTCTPPAITAQPTSRTITSGQSTSLTVTASGTTPLTYQWYIGTSGNTAQPISGATGPTVSVGPTTTTNYWVRIGNACGSVNSVTATVTVTTSGGVRQRTPVDFNGDGVSDFVLYRNGTWIAYNGSNGAQLWAIPTDTFGDGIPLPMDYDGDGRTEFSVYRPGRAWHFYNDNGSYLKGIWIGFPDAIAVPADYDGDGREDVMVYRPSTGQWIRFDYNTGAQVSTIQTEAYGDGVPLPIDYDGDGRAELSVYRPGRAWHFFNDNGSYLKGIWIGFADAIPVPGDYDGNGVEEVVIFRASAYFFYDFNSGQNTRGVFTGASSQNGDPIMPAPLDYDGDGSLDFTVFAGGAWVTFTDTGALRSIFSTGNVRGDLALSRRDLTRRAPPG